MFDELLSIPEGFGLADSVAMSVVAVLGYLFGRQSSGRVMNECSAGLRTELDRASRVAEEIELTSAGIQGELKRHRDSVRRFQKKVRKFQEAPTAEGWEVIGREADALLGPTLRLATHLAGSNEQLRKHANQLVTFADSRIDRLTGLHNRRAFQELLRAQLQVGHDMEASFSVVLLNLSPRPGTAVLTDEETQHFSAVLDEVRRANDVPAHTGVDEFAVILPQTKTTGAATFAKRLMDRVAQDTELTLYGAVVSSIRGESDERLLSRAGSALYSARAVGQSSLFLHTGISIQEYQLETEATRQLDSGDGSLGGEADGDKVDGHEKTGDQPAADEAVCAATGAA
ncbi:MAG: diguanylate cyclase [Planctomycetota bacterium]